MNRRLDNTVSLISKAKDLSDKYIVAKLKKHGLSDIAASHGGIIFHLLLNKTLRMSELAQLIDRDPSTVTALVKKLQTRGYVKMDKDTIDKRISHVYLTDKGYELEAAFLQISISLEQRLFQDIDQAQKEVFQQVLLKMICNLNEEER